MPLELDRHVDRDLTPGAGVRVGGQRLREAPRFDHQIVEQKLRGIAIVGRDAAHPGRGQQDAVRAFAGKPIAHCRLFAQIERARPGQHRAVFTRQPPNQGRTDHPAVSRNEDALAGEGKRCAGHHASRAIVASRMICMSLATISRTSSRTCVVCRQPSF